MLSIDPSGTTVGSVPTYVDFSGQELSVQIDRGRPDEFSQIAAGTAQVRLDSSDGRYDPTNQAGPYYGQLLPLLPVQLGIANPVTGGAVVPVFTGFIEEYEFTREGGDATGVGSRLTADVPMTDAMELFQNCDANTSTDPNVWGSTYAVQHVDNRIRAALADAGWDPTLTRIATGNVNVMGHYYERGSSILDVIRDAADAEFPGVGVFYVAKDGYAAFSGRFIRFGDPVSGQPPEVAYPNYVQRWAVGDAFVIFNGTGTTTSNGASIPDGERLPIAKDGLAWTFGKVNLFNDAVVSPDGVDAGGLSACQSTDAASVTQYGHRALPSIGGLIVYTGATPGVNAGNTGVQECFAFADYYVQNYKVPRDRVTSITFHGHMDSPGGGQGFVPGNLWDFILGVDINHIVNIKALHPGGGGFGCQTDGSGAGIDYIVEGVHHSVTNLNDLVPRWEMTLDLSPAAHYTTPPL